MSTSQDSKTLFKSNLTCIFLSVRAKFKKKIISGDPVGNWISLETVLSATVRQKKYWKKEFHKQSTKWGEIISEVTYNF